jgi:hypothetical protein
LAVGRYSKIAISQTEVKLQLCTEYRPTTNDQRYSLRDANLEVNVDKESRVDD